MKPHEHAELIKAWADGAEIQYSTDGQWHDAHTPAWIEGDAYRVKPERVYPVTGMRMDDFNRALYRGNHASCSLGSAIAIANAALRHAIDAGQVVAPVEAQPGIRPFDPYTGRRRDQRDIDSDPMGILIHHPDEPLRAASTRDMAIARAVENMCDSYVPGCHRKDPLSDQKMQCIIATVK